MRVAGFRQGEQGNDKSIQAGCGGEVCDFEGFEVEGCRAGQAAVAGKGSAGARRQPLGVPAAHDPSRHKQPKQLPRTTTTFARTATTHHHNRDNRQNDNNQPQPTPTAGAGALSHLHSLGPARRAGAGGAGAGTAMLRTAHLLGCRGRNEEGGERRGGRGEEFFARAQRIKGLGSSSSRQQCLSQLRAFPCLRSWLPLKPRSGPSQPHLPQPPRSHPRPVRFRACRAVQDIASSCLFPEISPLTQLPHPNASPHSAPSHFTAAPTSLATRFPQSTKPRLYLPPQITYHYHQPRSPHPAPSRC